MVAWEYAPLSIAGSPPDESDYIKAGPKLNADIGFGKEKVFISGSHTSSTPGATFKFFRVREHPLLQLPGLENYRMYEPVNPKRCSVMVFRQVPDACKVFHVVALSRTLAKISYSLSGNFVCDMPMDAEWTIATFKKKLLKILVDMNICSMQQQIDLDLEYMANMKVKTVLSDDYDPASKKRRLGR